MTLLEISCEEVWGALSDYIDDELTAGLRARLDAHFRKCQHCTAIYDGTRNIIQLVGDYQTFNIPSGFSERLKARLRRQISPLSS
ncbi:MAG: zf-HC2 domain-containing protein [Terriglobales bacterium]